MSHLNIKRIKNPWFWIGIVSTILTAAQINPSDLKTWNILGQKIIDLVNNPYMLGLVILALIGNWNNPTTTNKTFMDDKL